MNQEKIGKFIAELRKEKKWTQEDLANKLLVDRTIVSKWERGIYIPNAEILLQLNEIFNVSVNEILYGERRNESNNAGIDSIPIDIIKDGKRKIKNVLIICSSIIVGLLIAFFSYYFISNYNSIRVYTITGKNSNFHINDGLMITSREKSYIKIGEITKEETLEITNTRLYFKKKYKEYDIFSGTQELTNNLYVNNFKYDELFKYSDIKYIINNLYLELTLENEEVVVLDLNVEKDFSNNKIFSKTNFNSISRERIAPYSDSDAIPNYIIKNFEYNEEKNKYTYEKKRKNYTEIKEYLSDINTYKYLRVYKDHEEIFEYSPKNLSISYYCIKNNKMIYYYEYDFLNNKCQVGNCNNDELDNFIKNQINVIFK